MSYIIASLLENFKNGELRIENGGLPSFSILHSSLSCHFIQGKRILILVSPSALGRIVVKPHLALPKEKINLP